MDIFVARQPIFNRNQEVIAYELLYRDSEQNFFDGSVTSSIATSILLMNSYLNFGIEHLVGNYKAFVNFDKQLIMNDIPQLLNKEHVTIELLEDIVPDQSFIDKITHLKNIGYTLAIDDFVEDYKFTEVVKLCDIIKVEFLGATRASIQKICTTWKKEGKLLLAEKVETREEYEWARQIGFDYFQGFFFSKPTLVKSKGINDSATQYIKLMGEINSPVPDYKVISDLIEFDISLTYKLLKLVNSKFTAGNKVHSIRHSLSILGTDSLKKWLSLAMVQNHGASKGSAIVITSMVRSRLLGLIANHSSLKAHSQELSFIGILSVLNVILEKPMIELVEQLPVTDNIKNTLINEDTIYSPAYNLCLSYEKGDFKLLESYSNVINYDMNLLPTHYIEAVTWADNLYEFMHKDSLLL